MKLELEHTNIYVLGICAILLLSVVWYILRLYQLYIHPRQLKSVPFPTKSRSIQVLTWCVSVCIVGIVGWLGIHFTTSIHTSSKATLVENAPEQNIRIEDIQPSTDPNVIDKGKKQFAIYCTQCHGEQASGNIGPNLTDEYWIHGASTKDLVKVIYEGVPQKGMAAWGKQLSVDELSQIVSYLKSIQNTNIKGKSPQGFYYVLKGAEYVKDATKHEMLAEVRIPDDIPHIPTKGNAKHGRELFNAILGCAHCHGTDAIGHIDNRNLRETQNRYGKNYSRMIDMLLYKGRDGTAMPPWSHLPIKDLQDVKAFVVSIQNKKKA